MASVRRSPRTRGRWQVRYRDPFGRQRCQTFATAADARAFASAVDADIRRAEWRDPALDAITFAEWHARWWPTVAASDRAANTVVQYESLLRRHVLPYLGPRRLAGLRRIDFEEWLANLRTAGLGSSTIRTCRTVAGMVMRAAVDSDVIKANPLAGTRLIQRGGTTRARQALTVGQLEALASVAASLRYRELILVMGYGGLRPNEAFALRRRHVDDFGQVVVSEGLVEVRGRLVQTDGKTHRPRVVPLPQSVAALLEAHLGAHVASDADALLFTTQHGHPIGLRNFRRAFDSFVTEAGTPSWATPYTLRHTCASLLAQRGVPVTTAAALMGHDPAMFLRTYAHLYPGDLRGAADALDRARLDVDTNASPVALVPRADRQPGPTSSPTERASAS